MDLGFETIGNATLICHDKIPVLVTDPWITGPAYFGSWTRSHEIPAEQMANILASRFVWISHGHPDHLSADSIELLKGKKFLLPDHVGNRIFDGLRALGLDVNILKSRVWTSLSDRIRVMSIADYNQDGILLVDIDGTLIVNLNDASDRGWGRFVRQVVRGYKASFLLKLSGYGDAEMIHLFDEEGRFIAPPAARKEPVGKQISHLTSQYGVKFFVPFSSMHRYQRADSVWVNQFITPLEEYQNGFVSARCELLPAFIRYDCARQSLQRIDPPRTAQRVFSPEEFDDAWSETLSADDEAKLTAYINSFEHVRNHFAFIRFKIGGECHTIDLNAAKRGLGITFEAPRHSLMLAVEQETFDDLLIGNFMKTTLHGDHGTRPLYPDFTPYIAKYGDNGGARTDEELEAYFTQYRKRSPFDYFYQQLENRSAKIFRSLVSPDSPAYSIAKKIYYRVKEI
jgi:hypothetical protein